LRDEVGFLVGRVGKLEMMLADLKRDHNQNYHDMAVKAAVLGWDEMAKEEIPDFGLSDELLDHLEKDEVDLGDDDVDFTDEFDETVSLRIVSCHLSVLTASISYPGLLPFSGYGFCEGKGRVCPQSPHRPGLPKG
jgi:hypothetical protein